MSSLSITRVLCAAALVAFAAGTARAQGTAPAAKPAHPAVCAKGVRVYTDLAQLPSPHDSLSMPPAPGPVRVTNEEEAEAAELAMRGRAGSVGANAVVVTDKEVDNGAGERRITRNVAAYFVPADAEHSQQACK